MARLSSFLAHNFAVTRLFCGCHISDAKHSSKCNVISTAMSQLAPIRRMVNGWGLMMIRFWSVAFAHIGHVLFVAEI